MPPDEVGVYHCVARCVRRAFLCGVDPLTKHDYDYRKEWIRERLELLASVFAIDIFVADPARQVFVISRLDRSTASGDESRGDGNEDAASLAHELTESEDGTETRTQLGFSARAERKRNGY